MTKNRVIFSYVLSIVEVLIIMALVGVNLVSSGLGIMAASLIAGAAYGREKVWQLRSRIR